MTESEKQTPNPLLQTLSSVQELSERVLETYARLWQLEIWLRRMVYVEFRAAFGDQWEDGLDISTRSAENSRKSDEYLTHMPTPEVALLSYSTFGEVCKTIEKEWIYFQHYLPPKDLWNVKLYEIKQIRNRVAHFRHGHRDDLQRTLQLLRDIDQGFWLFCTSYNNASPVLPPTDDPVVAQFISLNPFPYQKVDDNKWAMSGIADTNAWFSMSIDVISRPWISKPISFPIEGKKGFLYDVVIVGRQEKYFDYRQYFDDTKELHKHFVHLIPDAFSKSVRVTIPSILGKDKIIKIINKLIFWLSNSLHSPLSRLSEERVKALSDEMPEYILNPNNPLAFLDPEMPCSFFGV